jgi:uncharacterized protein YdaU (DUF1376 family)
MAKDRPPSFQFYPRDWMSDPLVQSMSLEQQGRYIRALCCSWQTDSPGVATEGEWREWLLYSDRQWAIHRHKMMRPFKIDQNGRWIQKRMAEEREAQLRRYQRSKSGADVTNDKRWSSVAPRQLGESLSVSPSSFAFPSSSKKEKDLPALPASPLIGSSLVRESGKDGKRVLISSGEEHD